MAVESQRLCWRMERANRARVIVDAAAYFATMRAAMLRAQHRILMIGWDFDTRIELAPNDDAGSGPRELGAFILWLAKRRPDLEINILKWDVGALKLLARGTTLLTVMRWAVHKRITFNLDGAHPAGCSHHQKIVVIDDSFAVCGGIDMTGDRWDTPQHLDQDPRRRSPGGSAYGPWHDVTMAVDGAAARALGEWGRIRWSRATGRTLAASSVESDPWPSGLQADFRDVDVRIARTLAPYQDQGEVREVEALYLAHIAAARHFIYAENQYFASRRIAEAIARRLGEASPPEVVLILPQSSHGWLEQAAMDGARTRLLGALAARDRQKKLSVLSPVTAQGAPIYVHAKLLIVDDAVLRVGSSNMNNRSLGLDSECDLSLGDDGAASVATRVAIRKIRMQLLAEHCGCTVDSVEAALSANDSMRTFIDSRESAGRGLRALHSPPLGKIEQLVADKELLDPEAADAFFEPLAKRGLFRNRSWQRT